MLQAENARAQIKNEQVSWDEQVQQLSETVAHLEEKLQVETLAREQLAADHAKALRDVEVANKGWTDTKARMQALTDKFVATAGLVGPSAAVEKGRASTDLVKLRAEKRQNQDKLREKEQAVASLQDKVKKLEKQLDEKDAEIRELQNEPSGRRSPTPSMHEAPLARDGSNQSIMSMGATKQDNRRSMFSKEDNNKNGTGFLN